MWLRGRGSSEGWGGGQGGLKGKRRMGKGGAGSSWPGANLDCRPNKHQDVNGIIAPKGQKNSPNHQWITNCN